MLIESQAPEATTDTVDAIDVDTTQSEADGQNETAEGKEGKDTSKAKAQPAKAGSNKTAEKAETLRKLLRREKDDPNVVFKDAELDIYDEYIAGKLKPAKAPKKSAPVDPKAKEEDDVSDAEAPEENPVSDPVEGEEDEDSKADEADDEEGEDEDDASPDAEALMKEVGAKSLKDALAKVKQLRSKVGGRDSQQVAQLQKQVQSEQHLWSDVAKGVPAAIEHAERVYGIKLAKPGQNSQDGQSQQRQPIRRDEQNRQQGERKRAYVDESEFIDPDSAKAVNRILQDRDREIDELKTMYKDFAEEKERVRKDSSLQSAQGAVIDEMVQVAQGIPSLKAIGNLRESIASWYQGKPDARMESFNELFGIAQAEGCTLKAAASIKRGRDSEKLIAEAEERGRKAAYGHKPNPSLSGQQGGKGEKTTYQNLTDAQLEAMSENHSLIPDDWFDAKDNLDKNKMPKRAWGYFGFK